MDSILPADTEVNARSVVFFTRWRRSSSFDFFNAWHGSGPVPEQSRVRESAPPGEMGLAGRASLEHLFEVSSFCFRRPRHE